MTRGLVAMVALLFACGPRAAPPGGPPTEEDYPGDLVPSDQITTSFMARQRVTAQHPLGSSSFEAVLQSHAGELTLVGLTPFGTKAFVLRQRGIEIEFELLARQAGEQMPFPPKFILLDIHRTFFIGLPGAPLRDGEHEGEVSGERVRERWASGRLLERSFARVSGPPEGEIAIRYGGGLAPDEMPDRIELDNGWFGYRLTIETLSYQPL